MLLFILFSTGAAAQVPVISQPGPLVSSFSPSEAGAGATVIIIGNNFLDINAVNVGGKPAQSFKVISLTTIYAKVAQGAGSGIIAVTNINGTGSAAGFKFVSPPSISYPDNQNYTVTVPIPTLSPTNSGGAIPSNAYAKTSTVATTNYPGTGTSAPFTSTVSTVVDPLGNIYVADASKSEIKIISPAKVVNRFVTFGHLSSPNGMAMDDMGNIYVADQGNHRIRKVSASASVTTLAGHTTSGALDGTGTAASFNNPAAVALDAAGNIYVADQGNNLIRKISPAGTVSTFAGNGTAALVNGQGTSASFNAPAGITVDANDNIYVADKGNHVIRKITAQGMVSTVAGSGMAGALNGVGSAASFNSPGGITVDISGNIYIADTNNSLIRVISSQGAVSTLAGVAGGTYSADGNGTAAVFTRPTSVSIDLHGNLWVTDNLKLRTVALTGYKVNPELPAGLTLNSATGQITGIPTSLVNASYTITGTNAYGTSTTSLNLATAIPQVAPGIAFFSPFVCTAGATITISGTNLLGATGVTVGGVPASAFTVVSPTTMTAVVGPKASSGKLTVTNPFGSTSLNGFLAINPPDIIYSNPTATFTVGAEAAALTVTNSGGSVPNQLYLRSSIFAGSGKPGTADGTGSAASFNSPEITATDVYGNVYVGDFGNKVVRKITPVGVVSTIGSPSELQNYSPHGMVVDDSLNIYFSSSYGDWLTKLTPAGVAITLAGGGSGDDTNGQGSTASFGSIIGLTIDNKNNIYAADISASQIRKITPGGLVSRFSGTAWQGHKNGPINNAEFYYPDQIAIDPSGIIYIGDSGNKIIRKISSAGNVSDFAGGTVGFSDGTGTAAKFDRVGDIKTDPVGNVYVTDVGNNAIRKITPDGTVTTLLGNGLLGSIDGIGNTIALNKPGKLAIDQEGTIFLPDPSAHIIRKIPTTGYSISPELPAGLSLDGTGKISGTPTVITPATLYTVTACNLTGSSSTTINISTLASKTPPVITSFSPSQGPPGTVVTVMGSNFNYPTVFKIGGVDAILVSNTGTRIKLMVMPDAKTGAVSIETAAGTANGENFTVVPTGYPNQQHSRLVSNDLAASAIGEQVAISADRNTIVARNTRSGGLVFYTLTSSGWTSQNIHLKGIDTFKSDAFVASAAISADGNTVALGAPQTMPVYNGLITGGIYVFVKDADGRWIQQGRRLTGTGALPSTSAWNAQGSSIAISADGNTIIEGAPSDNNNQGAVWIFSRTAGVWTQMGSKLVGADNAGAANQGYSVSISADGNTAMAGGIADNFSYGSSWVFIRSGNVWVQQGGKLVASDIKSAALQGASVALSADGNTAIVGEKGTEYDDNGGAHVYVRKSGIWTQQSNRLDGASYYSNTFQGTAVAISADGNTAVMGGITHGFTVSANQNLLWVFTRNNNSWTETTVLSGKGYEPGNIDNNSYLSLTPDGNTAVLGSGVNNALWVFVNVGEAKVTTDPATNITTTSAALNGTATVGGETAAISIQYSTNPDMSNPVTAALSTGISPITPGSEIRSYSSNITGLTPGTTYYYRISSKNDIATIHGTVRSLSTLPLPPTITSFSPISAPAGTMITLSGTNLDRLTGASFGGTPATTYLGRSATSAIVYVPPSGSSGNISITTPGGTATLSGFTFISAPTITTSGPTTFTSGSNVVLSTAINTGYAYQWKRNGLNINGATAADYTATQAGSYTVTVLISGHSLTSSASVIHVISASPPVITSFSATTAKEGSTITITGINFTGTTSVSFGSTAATSFNVVSSTSITAVVGAGSSGNVLVTNPSGTANLPGFSFIPIPVITASGPTTFQTGGSVVLTAGPGTGYTCQWKKDGANISNATSSSFTAIEAGSYSVVINLNGVSQTSAATVVTVSNPAPVITSFSPTTANEGGIITLTGTNFTGTTSVSFGGTAATSFNVVSSTSITAVVGAGSSGNVSGTNPYGTATLPGFNFVPIPVIAASGPTTFNTGNSVVLTASPSAGYTYQWKKDGANISNATSSSFTATQAGAYTVVISLNGVSQTSAATTLTVTLTLPLTNFNIEALSSTCKGAKNGSIKIAAALQGNYTAVISIEGASNTIDFVNTLTINDLLAGNYRVCLAKTGQASTSQCFTINISEPEDLSLYVASIADKQVLLNLDGANVYYIKLNGVSYTTSESTITLPLAEGNNTISLASDVACQGTIEKNILLTKEPTVYPNPFENLLNISLGESSSPVAHINIFSLDGKSAYQASYTNPKGVIQLDLTGLNQGLYMLKLSTIKNDTIIKLIKR